MRKAILSLLLLNLVFVAFAANNSPYLKTFPNSRFTKQTKSELTRDNLPPSNVSLDPNGPEAVITWEEPNSNAEHLLAKYHTDEYIGWSVGYTAGAYEFVCAHEYTAEELMNYQGMYINSINICIAGPYSSYYLCIYTDDGETLLMEQDVTDLINIDTEYDWPLPTWNDLTLAEPFLIPTTGNMMIGYRVNNSGEEVTYDACADNGPIIEGGNLMRFNGEWMTLEDFDQEYPFYNNWAVEAMLSYPDSRDSEIELSKNIETTRNRDLIGYKVYRTLSEELSSPENWVLLTETDLDSDTFSFNDSEWLDLESGEYFYAVKAIYADGESTPSISEAVLQGYHGFVEATITDVDGNPIPDILVSLDGQTLAADGDGIAFFYHIYEGEQLITITDEEYFIESDQISISVDETSYINFVATSYTPTSPLARYITTEVFSYEACQYCPIAKATVAEMMENFDNIAPMFWNLDGVHPSPGFMARIDAVGTGGGFPQTTFGGLKLRVGADTEDNYSYFLTGFEPIFRLMAPLTISSSFVNNNGTLEITSDITMVENTTLENPILAYVVTYNISEEKFCHVGNYETEDFTPGAINETVEYQKSISLDSSLDLSDIHVWVFVQKFNEMIDFGEIENSEVYNCRESIDQNSSNEENTTPQLADLLLNNYPNPFNPATTISFSNLSSGPVLIAVYNTKGQKIKALVNEEMEAGTHSIDWNGTDDNNHPVSSGIYFYKMETNSSKKVRKMILMK